MARAFSGIYASNRKRIQLQTYWPVKRVLRLPKLLSPKRRNSPGITRKLVFGDRRRHPMQVTRPSNGNPNSRAAWDPKCERMTISR